MRWTLFFLVLICVPAPASELWLKVGEVRQIPATAEAVIRIGTRGIIRAIDSNAGVRIIGLKPGVSSLAIDGTSYLVRVSLSAEKDFAQSMRQATSRMMDSSSTQIKSALSFLEVSSAFPTGLP